MAGQPSRGNPRMGDVVRSVLVLGVGVLLVWGGAQVFTVTPDEPPVRAVDYASVLSGVERESGFVPVAPAALPDGWKATSARFRDETWFLGVLTEDERFVGLSQTAGAEDEVVAAQAPGSEREDDVDLGGDTWTRWSSPGGETTFSRVVPGTGGGADTTVVVTSDVAADTVERYVASLSAERS